MKTDSQIQENVMAELSWDPALDATGITVVVTNGIVTLSGHVHNYGDRTAAEQAILRVKGVKGIVGEPIVILTGDSFVNDDEIAANILRILKYHTAIPEETIKVRVVHGFVYLEGEVEWNFQKEAVFNAVRQLKGIVGVSNLIKIRPRVNQTILRDQIREALSRYAGLEADGITVTIADDRVILKGRTRSQREKEVVEQVAWSAPGVMAVQSELTID